MGGADHGALDETLARARELGVEDRITFAGYLDAAGKAAAFRDHDVYLNTNLIDNMPVSLLEASACGLVPVATAVGGIPAMVDDGVDGRLAPARDVDALADAILELLADPETFARLSAGARARAEQSGWKAVRRRWEDRFDRLFPELAE
jgi:phenylacetate-CoA ligase